MICRKKRHRATNVETTWQPVTSVRQVLSEGKTFIYFNARQKYDVSLSRIRCNDPHASSRSRSLIFAVHRWSTINPLTATRNRAEKRCFILLFWNLLRNVSNHRTNVNFRLIKYSICLFVDRRKEPDVLVVECSYWNLDWILPMPRELAFPYDQVSRHTRCAGPNEIWVHLTEQQRIDVHVLVREHCPLSHRPFPRRVAKIGRYRPSHGMGRFLSMLVGGQLDPDDESTPELFWCLPCHDRGG